MPSILTCLLAATTASDSGRSEAENGVLTPNDIRKHAASLLSLILERFGPAYPSFKPRVLKTLLRGLVGEPDGDVAGLGTRFGAVIGLRALGRDAVQSTLGIDVNLRALGDILAPALAGGQQKRSEAEQIVSAVTNALEGAYPSDIATGSSPVANAFDRFGPVFADAFTQLGSAGATVARAMTNQLLKVPASAAPDSASPNGKRAHTDDDDYDEDDEDGSEAMVEVL